jgi:hypothetical protein
MTVRIDGRIPDESPALQRVLRELAQAVVRIEEANQSGTGSPEGVRVGYKGYTYRRLDGGAGTCLYVFEGTNGTSTGWAGK